VNVRWSRPIGWWVKGAVPLGAMYGAGWLLAALGGETARRGNEIDRWLDRAISFMTGSVALKALWVVAIGCAAAGLVELVGKKGTRGQHPSSDQSPAARPSLET
jgi:hypothetical protein